MNETQQQIKRTKRLIKSLNGDAENAAYRDGLVKHLKKLESQSVAESLRTADGDDDDPRSGDADKEQSLHDSGVVPGGKTQALED